MISAVGRCMCFSLAELLIPEKGFVGLCAPISVCMCVYVEWVDALRRTL